MMTPITLRPVLGDSSHGDAPSASVMSCSAIAMASVNANQKTRRRMGPCCAMDQKPGVLRGFATVFRDAMRVGVVFIHFFRGHDVGNVHDARILSCVELHRLGPHMGDAAALSAVIIKP